MRAFVGVLFALATTALCSGRAESSLEDRRGNRIVSAVPRTKKVLNRDDHKPRPFLGSKGNGPESVFYTYQRGRDGMVENLASPRVSFRPEGDASFSSKGFPFGELPVSPLQIQSGGTVNVDISKIRADSEYDFVAIYCPPKGINDLDFLDFMNVTQAVNGVLAFDDLVNLRCDYAFRYFRVSSRNPSRPVLAHVSKTVQMLYHDEIDHVHLAMNRDGSTMTVQFTRSVQDAFYISMGSSPDLQNATARCLQGDAGCTVSVSTYAATDMCGQIANVTAQQFFRSPGFLYRATLTNLPRDTRFYYRIVANSTRGVITSEVSSFRTPPPLGVQQTTRFLAYADMGLDPAPAAVATAQRALQEMLATPSFDDFVIHFGDISYARGQAYQWDQFMTLIEPYASRAPYMVSVGNHEFDVAGRGWHPVWGDMSNDSNGECGVPTLARFAMPSDPAHAGQFWYDFIYGNVHVVQFSSEHDWTQGSEQWQWLQKTLAAVDRSLTPWLIVTAHRPMYTSETLEEYDFRVSLHMQEALEDMFYKYGVDIFFTGHYHSYERTCAVYRGECVESGRAPIHACVGTAGAGLEGGVFPPGFPWSVSHINAFGYSKIEATKTTLSYKFILNTDGSVFDSFTLTR